MISALAKIPGKIRQLSLEVVPAKSDLADLGKPKPAGLAWKVLLGIVPGLSAVKLLPARPMASRTHIPANAARPLVVMATHLA